MGLVGAMAGHLDLADLDPALSLRNYVTHFLPHRLVDPLVVVLLHPRRHLNLHLLVVVCLVEVVTMEAAQVVAGVVLMAVDARAALRVHAVCVVVKDLATLDAMSRDQHDTKSQLIHGPSSDSVEGDWHSCEALKGEV